MYDYYMNSCFYAFLSVKSTELTDAFDLYCMQTCILYGIDSKLLYFMDLNCIEIPCLPHLLCSAANAASFSFFFVD